MITKANKIFALLLALCLVLSMVPVFPASAAETLASYYSTNAAGTGAKKTITVDGDISDWNSSMLIAQGTANDDPRVYRPNSMYEIPIDLYALYAAYDNENLYLMWEMTNVQDVVAPNDNYPLSQGVLFQTMNVPFFIAIDTGDAATAIGNNGALISGGTIWDSGITFGQSFNKLIAISTNGANGPFLYGGNSQGLNPVEEAARAEVGMTFDYGLGILSKNVYGIDKAYGEYNNRVVGDMCNENAAWVDFNTLGHSTATMDFHYEMSVSLASLGVTAADVESRGLGVLLVATMGKSGMDCLPYDLSMNDQADLDDAAGSQEFNSFEKSDLDFITTSFARVGNATVTPTEPTTPSTPTTPSNPTTPSEPATEPTEPTVPSTPTVPSYPQGVIYLKPGTDWMIDGARFAAYFWDGNGKEVWVDGTDADGDGYYEIKIPEGCTNVLFCRMNGSTTANNWDNRWNQTEDYTVPTDEKIAFIKDNGWNTTGHWEAYTPADWECTHGSHDQNGNCTSCGEAVQHSYTSKVTAPTCTEDGYTTHTCVCGKSYKDNTVPAIGHNYVNGFCANCGEETTLCTDGKEHTFNAGVISVSPTCSTAGVKTFSCTKCGKTKTESIPAMGHNFVNGICARCGIAQECTTHIWNDGVDTVAPTCTATGIKTYTCTVCGTTKTEVTLSLGHNYVDGKCSHCGQKENCSHFWRSPSSVSATCEKDGSYTETCLFCGGKRTEIIPAKGHKYAAGRCYVCGKEQQEPLLFIDIANAADLLAFANRVNAGETELNGRLVANIDLGGAAWTAIGYYCKNGESGNSLFYKGRFDGQGYTVSNFKSAGTDCEGLFGYCEIAVIENLGITNANITGWNAGAIAGYAPTSEILNCFVKDCTITGYTNNAVALTSRKVHIGSVTGANSGTVKNCYAINVTLVDKSGSMTVPAGETYTPYHTCNLSAMGGVIRSNNYYMNITAPAFSSTSGAEEATAAQFASGEITYKLNKEVTDGTQAWYQTCGVGLPAHSGLTVYLENGKYVNKLTACTHAWVDATCVTPKTCSKCGETEGTALGHSWNAATCTAPQTCSKCGAMTGSALDHNYVNGYCSDCGTKDPNYVAPITAPTLTPTGFTLSFEDEILVNFYYTISDTTNVAEQGMLVFYQNPGQADVAKANAVYTGSEANGSFISTTDGIAAKEMGDDRYYCAYAKLSNGEYVYSALHQYSPKKYATNMLGRDSTSLKQKALCVAMLNYGAAAQEFFGYRTDSLMNAGLTAEQKALIAAYDASLFTGAVAADASKVGGFAATATGFSSKSASVSFEGAFAINYYFAPSAAINGDMKLYIWSPADFAAVNRLTTKNATAVVVMQQQANGTYWGQVEGIAAKMLDQTYYVAGVYTDANGNTYSTGVVAYSLSKYCMNNAYGNMGALAQATAMYGYYADQYFAN